MNVFFGLLSLVSCTVIGYMLSTKFSKRKKFYINFATFNKKLENEISFSQKTLIDLVNSGVDAGEFEKCVKNYFENKKLDIQQNLLKNDEIDFIKTYLETIGSSDKITQIKYLESASKTIENNLNAAIEDDRKYKALYIKLGFLFGLMVFVVLL